MADPHLQTPEPHGAAGKERLRRDLDTLMRSAAERQGPIPGLAVAVRRGPDELVVAHGLPVDQPQRACSITKLFTATLVVRLARAGTLDLDAPVAATLPTLRLADPAARAQLTPRHLLTHSSGLEGELPDLDSYGDDDGARLRMIASYDALAQITPPGAAYGYCNTGFWLLGALVDAVCGMPYERAVQELVIAPLGLRRTSVATHLDSGAMGHLARDGKPHPNPDGLRMPRVRTPSGGVVSTVAELAAFGAAHLHGAWGMSAAELAELRRPHVATTGPDGHYGLGFWLGPSATIAGHQGGYGGFQSQLLIVPKVDLVLAALANGEAGFEAIQEVLGGLLELLAGPAAVADWSPARPPAVALRPEERERLAGEYEASGCRIAVAFDGPDCTLTVPEDDTEHRLRAEAVGPRTLVVREPGAFEGSVLDFPAVNGTGHLVARFDGILLAPV